jgi:hypothetical protein
MEKINTKGVQQHVEQINSSSVIIKQAKNERCLTQKAPPTSGRIKGRSNSL